MTGQTTRRSFIAATVALAPAVALGATMTATDPATAFRAAEVAFNAGRVSEEAYDTALQALIDWEPATPCDFTRKVICLFGDGGLPERHIINRLVAQGIRLTGAVA